MPRRTKAAMAAGQAASVDPTEFVGRNDRGAVRPADDRYLEDAELDARDAYLLEVTGPEAQQLLAKRQALRLLLEDLSDDDLGEIAKGADVDGDLERRAILDRLEESATTMPNAEYRELLGRLEQYLEDAEDRDVSASPAQPEQEVTA